MSQLICENLSVSESGHLLFAGQDTAELAGKYGTPLYLMDEQRIRHNCRVYTSAFARNFSAESRPLFAGKACSFKRLYRIVAEEGLGVDVVSAGEICTAYAELGNLSMAFFHSNNKTDEDISLAMERGVGYFVVDHADELDAVAAEAKRRGICQKILLRLTPGIDPHTYTAVNTGCVDSKFGTAIETGQAEELVAYALKLSSVKLAGFHCHVGSQVFGEDVFERACVVMLEFMAQIRSRLGYLARMLDLGGGYGVRYTDSDDSIDIGKRIDSLAAVIHTTCSRLNLPEPDIFMEPGRSIVADAGLTLYTVGTVKRIKGYKNYVSVDGGMTDNPRYALYGSRYTCYAANRMNETSGMPCDLVGRCCESGDILQPGILLPDGIHRGDLIAVATTGAYNYSMASNYNRIPRPPVVMLRGKENYIAVRRERPEDMVLLDN